MENIKFNPKKIYSLSFKQNKTKVTSNVISKIPSKDTGEIITYCINYFTKINRQNKIINFSALQDLNIPNLQIVLDKGVRGETLSSQKNRKFLPKIKELGIKTIIDLRTQDSTEKYKETCEKLGFKYFHFPFDEKKVSDRAILDILPTLFKLLDDGNFYIACAQGLHRTDIALATDYVFNPKRITPHIMYGHTENHKTNVQKIFTRLNSLYNSMTENDKKILGWTEEFEKNFKHRKQNLKRYSEIQNL